MLKQLKVKNFALIENAAIEFENGFTVITGETGSGKSILLGALHLILGERADYSVIRDRDQKTIVEGEFILPKDRLKALFEQYDLDYEEQTFIRREINAKGKSRAFVNDTPVQLAVLKDIAAALIHIHSQHHTLELKNADFQRELLDFYGQLNERTQRFRKAFSAWKKQVKRLEALKEKQSSLTLNEEFNAFQLEELYSLELSTKDYDRIEEELQRAEEFEDIKKGLDMITGLVNEEGGVTDQLHHINKAVNVKDQRINELLQRIASVRIELDDIAATAADERLSLDGEPGSIETLAQELDAYNNALKKHARQSQEGLLQLQNELENEANATEDLDTEIEALTNEVVQKENELRKEAELLSEQRQKAAKKIEKEVALELAALKLPKAQIHFTFERGSLTEFGQDKIALLFQPNQGVEAKKVEKSASGGELSRLMLVIQYLLSSKRALPTVIFDEIDSGVSGEVANKIGHHLSKMGSNMQLLAITHLPQVASKGSAHIKLFKTEVKGKTQTYLNKLDEEERVEEIAQLMSGEKINAAALENARNLLKES
ncbi:MAG: DNA repair protein RecN [Bacteroidota bacterium]